MAGKKSQNDIEIQRDEAISICGSTGHRQFGHDALQCSLAYGVAEFAFDGDTLQFQFLAGVEVFETSCDPATQVRDLKQLTARGYQLTDVQPVDLFSHTRNLECVMTLVKSTV